MFFSSPPDVTISIDRSTYTVRESSRSVDVCARMTGQNDINSTVYLSIVPGSAGIYQLSCTSASTGVLASAMSNFTHVNSCRHPI